MLNGPLLMAIIFILFRDTMFNKYNFSSEQLSHSIIDSKINNFSFKRSVYTFSVCPTWVHSLQNWPLAISLLSKRRKKNLIPSCQPNLRDCNVIHISIEKTYCTMYMLLKSCCQAPHILFLLNEILCLYSCHCCYC